ncbi:MAG TPA: response regulator transcription factor [Kofleriaceae bacterium]|nr:response regulator transcription factor [Kofleriaceae bacterium]
MTRVLIVCDRALVREGLRRMLEGAPDVIIDGHAADPPEALALLSHAPDVVLVDFAMPIKDGLAATAELCRSAGASRVLVLGGYADQQHAQGAFEAGASGFLWKGADVAELLEAIRTVEGGGRYVSPQVAAGLNGGALGAERPASLDSLSKRELEVMCFLATGMTNREIAEQLGISVKTIDTHRGHLLKKLQLRNNSDITRFAIRHGLVQL